MTNLALLRKNYETKFELIALNDFEKKLLRACFDNLESTNSLNFNNFAYGLRELFRNVFHRLAPDESVRACKWYKPDSTAKEGITRLHRAKYMVQGGLSDNFVASKLGIDVNEALKELPQLFKTLSNYTHINPHTFELTKLDVKTLSEQCLETSTTFIEIIRQCRDQVLESLSSAIDEHLLSNALSETVIELDELATHHLIDEIEVDSSEIIEIESDGLNIKVEGSVGVELQYGSGSDVRNDIGDVMSVSFPFTAELHVRFERPLGKHAKVVRFLVDTQSFYE